jgi:prepilin signal peptidase PulO-like enzyme (type II secretory pathway)
MAAALVGGGMMAAGKLWYRRHSGKDGLGWGDVKLVAALGLWMGTELALSVALAAALALGWTAAARPANRRLPFGPFLTVGAIAVGFGRGWWPTI